MKITMQYPRMAGNKFYDGREHTIVPERLVMLDGQKSLYALYYQDETLGKDNMITLLWKVKDGVFYKVPLTDYKLVSKLASECVKKGKSVPLSEIKGNIEATVNKAYDYSAITRGQVLLEDVFKDHLPQPQTETKMVKKPPVNYASSGIIYFNTVDGKYYFDPACTRCIIGLPGIFGEIIDGGRKVRTATGKTYEVKKVSVNRMEPPTYQSGPRESGNRGQATATPPIPPRSGPSLPAASSAPSDPPKIDGMTRLDSVYYNLADGFYYKDKECTERINGAPECLGRISNDKTKIYGNDVIYVIIKVYVKHINYIEQIKIFFNEADGQYYCEAECRCMLLLAPKSLGVLSADGTVIDNENGTVYVIEKVNVRRRRTQSVAFQIFYNVLDGKYYHDPACRTIINAAPKELGKMSSDRTIITNDHGKDYLVRKVYVNTASRPQAIQLFYDEANDGYYYDPEYRFPLNGTLDSLGNVIDNGTTLAIIGNKGTVYFAERGKRRGQK